MHRYLTSLVEPCYLPPNSVASGSLAHRTSLSTTLPAPSRAPNVFFFVKHIYFLIFHSRWKLLKCNVCHLLYDDTLHSINVEVSLNLVFGIYYVWGSFKTWILSHCPFASTTLHFSISKSLPGYQCCTHYIYLILFLQRLLQHSLPYDSHFLFAWPSYWQLEL